MSKDIYLPKKSNFKEGDRIALVGRYKDNAETNQILLAPANIDLDPSEIIDKVTVLEKDKTNELYFVLERARVESGYEFNTMFGETVLTVKQHPYIRQTIKINSMYVDSSFDYANIVFVRRGERTIELLPESKYKELKKSGKIIRPAHKVVSSCFDGEGNLIVCIDGIMTEKVSYGPNNTTNGIAITYNNPYYFAEDDVKIDDKVMPNCTYLNLSEKNTIGLPKVPNIIREDVAFILPEYNDNFLVMVRKDEAEQHGENIIFRGTLGLDGGEVHKFATLLFDEESAARIREINANQVQYGESRMVLEIDKDRTVRIYLNTKTFGEKIREEKEKSL